MQTFNSFGELAAAQCASPLVSNMSVFNAATGMDESIGAWFRKEHSDDFQAGNVADISFAELFKRYVRDIPYYEAIGEDKTIDTEVNEILFKELAKRLDIHVEDLDAVINALQ